MTDSEMEQKAREWRLAQERYVIGSISRFDGGIAETDKVLAAFGSAVREETLREVMAIIEQDKDVPLAKQRLFRKIEKLAQGGRDGD